MKAAIFTACMIVPVIVLAVALVSKFKPNQEINSTFGYRTQKSMSSQENWDKAQELSTKYLLIAGIVLTIISLIAGLVIVNKFEMPLLIVAYAILTVVQIVVIVLSIPFVESQLK